MKINTLYILVKRTRNYILAQTDLYINTDRKYVQNINSV